MTAVTGSPAVPTASTRLITPSMKAGAAGSPNSSNPGIGLPYGLSVGWSSISSKRRSTCSLITCSQRQASSCTNAQSRPITSARSRSARRCLRITWMARRRPSTVSSRWRSPSTTTSPSRSMRPMVCETVGPEWPSRSEIRARSGTMCSSSRSRMVRRYISVVSTRSVMIQD